MRAIITCTAKIDDVELVDFLSDINWRLTNIENEDSLRQLENCMMEDILDHIPHEPSEVVPGNGLEDPAKCAAESQKVLAQQTIICVLYNDETKTWGILTRSNEHTVKFRLRNPYSNRLQRACKNLIKSLQSEYPEHRIKKEKKCNHTTEPTEKTKTDYLTLLKCFGSKRKYFRKTCRFEIHPTIDILEKRSDVSSYHGIVRHRHSFITLLRENEIEVVTAVVVLALAFSLVVITCPIIPPDVPDSNFFLFKTAASNSIITIDDPSAFNTWIQATLDRLTSALLVTSGILSLELFLRWATIRREPTIRWITEKL